MPTKNVLIDKTLAYLIVLIGQNVGYEGTNSTKKTLNIVPHVSWKRSEQIFQSASPWLHRKSCTMNSNKEVNCLEYQDEIN